MDVDAPGAELITVHDLPDDVCTHIFSFLDGPVSVCRARSVCKQWRTAGSVNLLWSQMYLQRWGEPLRSTVAWSQLYSDAHMAKGNALRGHAKAVRHCDHVGKICCVGFIHNSTEDYISCSYDGSICIYNGITGNLRGRLAGHTGSHGENQLLSITGTRLATVGEQNLPIIVSVSNGEQLKQFTPKKPQTHVSFVLREDGQHLLTAGDDKECHIFDMITGNELQTFTEPFLIWSAQLAGPLAITLCADSRVSLWDIGSANCVASLPQCSTTTVSDVQLYDTYLLRAVGDQFQVFDMRNLDSALHTLTVRHTAWHMRECGVPDTVVVATAFGECGMFNYVTGLVEWLPGVEQIATIDVDHTTLVVSSNSDLKVFDLTRKKCTGNLGSGVKQTALRLTEFGLLAGANDYQFTHYEFRGK
eukprot:TRINITY_DN5271_c0_g1_i1.p1 TRINITY_DN5271_c0_g1~~TRINITY_DN5271_c0_g1_i1.p1  ORF type:complete len:457 (-),score=61.42 TRINITY_DN5271_c0_g1_i1:414-1664(-)